MKETLEEKLARIGAEAEAGESDQTDRPLPPHVKVSRPNRARSKVLQVRLNPEELEALEAIAERRGVPVSTVARGQLLGLVEQEHAAAGTGDRTSALIGQLLLLSTELRDVHEARSAVTTKPPPTV